MFRRRVSKQMRYWIKDRLEWDIEWADECALNAEDREIVSAMEHLAWLKELQAEAERL